MIPGLASYSSPSPSIVDSHPDGPDDLDKEFVAQLKKGIPPPADEATVRRWLSAYSQVLDAFYASSNRVDEEAVHAACTHARNQIAPFASKDWAASAIAKFPCLRDAPSDDVFSIGEMFASRFRKRRNTSVSARATAPPPDPEVADHPNASPFPEQIDLTAPSVHEDSPPPHTPRVVQRRKTGTTPIKSPSPAARRARRPTIKAVATPPPTRRSTRSTAKRGRIFPRPSPRVTNGPAPVKRLWAEHAPTGMTIYADFRNPEDFCTTCWNIGASTRCVFTHPNICRRCQESVKGCHDHAAMPETTVVSVEPPVPAPDDTKIPETTAQQQLHMVDSSRTRKRKRSPVQKDIDEPADEDVDELHEDVATPPVDINVDDDTSRPPKRPRASKFDVEVVVPTFAEVQDSARSPSAPADVAQPPPVTPHTWAEFQSNVFTAEKIARGREILFPAVIADDIARPVSPTTTFTVPAMFDANTLYGTLMEQFKYYQTKAYACENIAAYLWSQIVKLRSGGFAALGVPTTPDSEHSGRATRSSSLRGRGRARGGSSRGVRGG
ncbi:hypothetical protein EIP86_010974 [Pleurotus ostreatoroseus]|nr:hypothetical protein EIP86_010974 [Pleurotus ostreatoroseus]